MPTPEITVPAATLLKKRNRPRNLLSHSIIIYFTEFMSNNYYPGNRFQTGKAPRLPGNRTIGRSEPHLHTSYTYFPLLSVSFKPFLCKT